MLNGGGSADVFKDSKLLLSLVYWPLFVVV